METFQHQTKNVEVLLPLLATVLLRLTEATTLRENRVAGKNSCWDPPVGIAEVHPVIDDRPENRRRRSHVQIHWLRLPFSGLRMVYNQMLVLLLFCVFVPYKYYYAIVLLHTSKCLFVWTSESVTVCFKRRNIEIPDTHDFSDIHYVLMLVGRERARLFITPYFAP
jgi:hypothetical protein